MKPTWREPEHVSPLGWNASDEQEPREPEDEPGKGTATERSKLVDALLGLPGVMPK